MNKNKFKSLKTLQNELFELVKEKYYNSDSEIQECINKINTKQKEMQERKQERESLGGKIKRVISVISFQTLQLCNKLIIKERISNKIMEYPISDELKQAESEIFEELKKCVK